MESDAANDRNEIGAKSVPGMAALVNSLRKLFSLVVDPCYRTRGRPACRVIQNAVGNRHACLDHGISECGSDVMQTPRFETSTEKFVES